jgi:hypothetical protein
VLIYAQVGNRLPYSFALLFVYAFGISFA